MNADGGRWLRTCSHPNLKARAFSVEKLEQFAKAGYTELGLDGILRTPTGKRLSFVFTTPYKRLDSRRDDRSQGGSQEG